MSHQVSRKNPSLGSKDGPKPAKRARTDSSSSHPRLSENAPTTAKAKAKKGVTFASSSSERGEREHSSPSSAKQQKPVKSVRIQDTTPGKGKGKAKASVPTSAPSSASAPVTKKVKAKSAATSSSSASTAAVPSTPALPRGFTIVAGSYEKLLYGIEGTYPPTSSTSTSSDAPPTPTLKPVFIFPAHVASVKAVAASPSQSATGTSIGGSKWLVTGSSDEIIKVWDLRKRKEVGGLMQHTGSITHLSFPSPTHLLSASEDGTISLFHTRDWSVLLTLKGHLGRINSVAVHPSGKVALSVGKDRALRMWDLMRGKASASTLLGKEGEVVRWSAVGGEFVVVSGREVDVYSTDMNRLQSITHPSRIQDVRYGRHPDGGEDLLFVAAENKKVSIYARRAEFYIAPDEEENEDEEGKTGGKEGKEKMAYGIIAELVGHANRVKAIDLLTLSVSSNSPSASAQSRTILASCSSDGLIHVYDLSSLPSNSNSSPSSSASSEGEKGNVILAIEPVAKYDTKGTRLTCLTLAASVPSPASLAGDEVGGKAGGVKRTREEDESDDDAEEGSGDEEEAGEGEEEDEEA